MTQQTAPVNEALENCIAEVSRMSAWHRARSAEISQLGFTGRSMVRRGANPVSVGKWYNAACDNLRGAKDWSVA